MILVIGKFDHHQKNRNGKRKNGIYYSSNGDKIEGEWKDNCLEGFVIYSTSNGYKYEGVLNKTLKDGYGIINLPNGINIEGLFKNLKI